MLNEVLTGWWFARPRFRPAAALFDAAWYRAAYPEVRAKEIDPFLHYMSKGWRAGFNPHPLFDTKYYLDTNDDVREAGINPFLHFVHSGWREGRDCHPLFSVYWYLEQNPDVVAAGVNPLVHYLEVGAAEGRDPHPSFDSKAYQASIPDDPEARAQPLLHYLASNPVVRQPSLGPRRPRASRSIVSHFKHVVDLAAGEHEAAPAVGHAVKDGPLLSFVVPVYNTKPGYLDDLLASFRAQPDDLAELVLSDDGSSSAKTRAWLTGHESDAKVTVVWNSENRGIAAATNAGLAAARGVWVGLLDHDDALAPFAVSRIAAALERNPQCQLLYTDEVITDKKLRPVGYFLKPAWDLVLLSGVNYINHLSVYRKDRLREIGGLREGFQGSQDYDLLLRYVSGLRPKEILHLPYPAYLWRRDGASYSAKFLAASTANARRALGQHFRSGDRDAVVDQALSPDLHRIRFDSGRTEWPLVSVVIPSRDGLPLISRVLEGLTKTTDYPALDILVIDNGTTDPAVLSLYERFRTGPVPFEAHVAAEKFNFSRSVNRGVSLARGELVLLLNNDIEILSRDWLKEMVSCFDYPGTGIVGAKLLYPDRTIQHVGVIAGLGGLAGHWCIGDKETSPGPQGRLRVRQSLSAVTGACMLVSKTCFEQVGAFDEDVFPIAYNDVDFCLRAVERGFRVVLTPFATLIHHESASRGSDETPENIARFNRDKRSLRERHKTDEYQDRAFNPWYAKHHRGLAPALLGHLPSER